jgi:tryptophan-rich sensory protein
MAARTPSVLNAAIELGFVLGAGALGWFGSPIWTVIALAVAMIAYWMWNRRAGLTQLAGMGIAKFAATAALSIALVALFLAGAYVLGRFFSGGFK